MTVDAVATKKRMGRRIVRAREGAGLNQRQLAERLVSRFDGSVQNGSGQWHRAVTTMQRSLRRYENGHNVPRGDLLMAIAEETETDVHHFSSLDDEDEEDSEAAMRRVAAELIVRGEDDLAMTLMEIVRRVAQEQGRLEVEA